MEHDPITPSKTRGMRLIEARYGQPVETLLNELYHGRGLTQTDIAERWGVSNALISRWMAALRIETRVFGPDRLAEIVSERPAHAEGDSRAEQAERRPAAHGVLVGSD